VVTVNDPTVTRRTQLCGKDSTASQPHLAPKTGLYLWINVTVKNKANYVFFNSDGSFVSFVNYVNR